MTDSVFWDKEPVLDLTHYVFKHARKGITIYGTWVATENGHRPCLALIRQGEEQHRHTIPCVLTLEKAYAFDQYVGNQSVGAAILIEFLEKLRLEPTRQNAFLIFSLINDHLDDLLSMPPYAEPDRKTKNLGVLTISSEVGRVEKLIQVRHV